MKDLLMLLFMNKMSGDLFGKKTKAAILGVALAKAVIGIIAAIGGIAIIICAFSTFKVNYSTVSENYDTASERIAAMEEDPSVKEENREEFYSTASGIFSMVEDFQKNTETTTTEPSSNNYDEVSSKIAEESEKVYAEADAFNNKTQQP